MGNLRIVYHCVIRKTETYSFISSGIRPLLFMSFFLIAIHTFSQSSVFDKLDFKNTHLKKVNNSYQNKKQKKALEELLFVFRKKENLYLRINPEDRGYVKLEHKTGVSKSINTANEVLKNYFLFRDEWDMEKTNVPYQFKKEINWQINPFGDIEWTYMLNRHKFFIDLGKAYYLTENEKYAKAFVAQVEHWIANNPLEERLKNTSWRRIDAGIRCENWIKAFEYVKNSKHITPEFLARFLNTLYVHGEYINSEFTDFSRTSNWGILEYHGLFNLALFLEEFKMASQWKFDAIEKLTACFELQILDDGNHWEHSAMYHNEIFHCILNLKLLANQKNIALSEIIKKKAITMAYANVKWQKPNFHQPLLGDSDDTDLRGLLTLASNVLHDSVLKSRAYAVLDYENLFLLGRAQNERYQKLEATNPDFLSVYQKNSGDFYMRTSWDEDAAYTSLHLKKLGCGHCHDNIFHFNLYANQRDYLVDAGRYTYVNNKWREFFKSSINHNTLGVDNLANSVYETSWANSFEARSQGMFTKSESDFDYAEAENTAYKRLKDPVLLKRRMLFLKPNVWLIFDSFSANGNHKYSQYFNFPNTKVDVLDKGLITTYKKQNLRIQPVKHVDIKLSDSWYSPEYNLKQKSIKAELSTVSTGFTSFISLLYFPEDTALTYKKIPVYDRFDAVVDDKYVEAVSITFLDKEYTLVVTHDSPAPKRFFFKVHGTFIRNEVVLIEKKEKASVIHIIKE
ncbi:alginate lyase family protein [Mariniflexile ostreae]|uniref:Alginate lyase family protein n=1 Tax=Mariniflexile ostreae TaxID=1520892 RepID=A0ABV5FCR2_9FLAO